MGSLVAALASYLDARSHNGTWLVRMEDLDPPRESKEAADQILFALDELGLHWDGSVLYQSKRHDAYLDAINTLESQTLVFACDCSRQQIQEHGGTYPGTCRERQLPAKKGTALRCRVGNEDQYFSDRLQGSQRQSLKEEVGDFVIRRKDGLYAYQLAVVVDDAFQEVSHIVRGIDLMDSTPRQIYLQKALGLPQPHYMHIPVIINAQGQKLSKQHHAAPIATSRPEALLVQALEYLDQAPDPALLNSTADDILAWGIRHWQPQGLTGKQSLDERITSG